ncbi:MAG: hypothetical protein M3Q34_02715 [bacterium]|nr:hypothetical protein [bacterium]
MKRAFLFATLLVLFAFLLRDNEEKEVQLPDLTEQPPLLNRDSAERAFILSLGNASDKAYVSALEERYGGQLDTRVRYWFSATGRNLADSAVLLFVRIGYVEGQKIRQEIRNPDSQNGRDTIEGLLSGKHIFISVQNDPPNNGDYQLLCMNGLVGDWGDATPNYHRDAYAVYDNEITISKGGSLCRDLKMTWQEAEAFARANGLKSYWKHGQFYVLVHPGTRFFKTATRGIQQHPGENPNEE